MQRYSMYCEYTYSLFTFHLIGIPLVILLESSMRSCVHTVDNNWKVHQGCLSRVIESISAKVLTNYRGILWIVTVPFTYNIRRFRQTSQDILHAHYMYNTRRDTQKHARARTHTHTHASNNVIHNSSY